MSAYKNTYIETLNRVLDSLDSYKPILVDLKYKKPIQVFFDMDGVLAEYHPDTVTLMHNPMFFYERPVDLVGLTLLEECLAKPDVDVHILSKAISEQCETEKLLWLLKVVPTLKPENIHILTMEEKKSAYAKAGYRNILIDDMSENLREWQQAGHEPVKYFNTINSRNWKATGLPYLDGTISLLENMSLLDRILSNHS